MCGIAGILGGRPGTDLAALARRMANTLAHRGPDDGAVWSDDGAGISLAHRRLAILDLTPAGHQPMVSSSGRFVIVFNGEIYNHGEVRKEIDAHGLRAWRGRSDTETFLTACEVFGIRGALLRSVGMFAFALWDQSERALYLARDRVGEKPLYWSKSSNGVIFASELKALRCVPWLNREIDRYSLAMFMRHNYVPAPHCIYAGVRKLRAGELLRVSAKGHECAIESYWTARDMIARGLAEPFRGDVNEALSAIEESLGRSIGQQMIADVPLGAFLSGGIDSSLVVALMQAQSARPVKTFTIGFSEQDYNEAAHAKAVAAHLGTEHTELYVSPSEALSVIPKLPEIYDEPFADSSQIPTVLVSRLARGSVTVSLSGDGGDELFGGYNRYLWTSQLARRLRWIPPLARRQIGRAIRGISVERWDRLGRTLTRALPAKYRHLQIGDKAHKLAHAMHLRSPHEIYMRFLSHWHDPSCVVRGLSDRLESLTDMTPPLRSSVENEMMYFDLVNYLPDDILVKVDRAAMSVSLETRVPFLDHRLIELAWRMPLDWKVRGREGKWLLRQILFRHVPRKLIDRPKVGFGVPIAEWLRGPLRAWAEGLLDQNRLDVEGYLDPVAVRAKWREHQSGSRNWAYLLWDVLMFQSWLESQ